MIIFVLTTFFKCVENDHLYFQLETKSPLSFAICLREDQKNMVALLLMNFSIDYNNKSWTGFFDDVVEPTVFSTNFTNLDLRRLIC